MKKPRMRGGGGQEKKSRMMSTIATTMPKTIFPV